MTAAAPIKIDLWTDIVCPWCYVGEARLQEAIRAEGLEDRVELKVHSFELDPTAPEPEDAPDNTAHLAKKLGKSVDEIRQLEGRIAALAADVNLPWASERKVANTRRIHRLLQLANESGKGEELFATLQRGYFADEIAVFDVEALIAEAAKVGIDEAAARAAMESESEQELSVERDVMRARQLGVSGVPFMVFNNKYAAPGAMEVDAYRQALRVLAEETEEDAIV